MLSVLLRTSKYSELKLVCKAANLHEWIMLPKRCRAVTAQAALAVPLPPGVMLYCYSVPGPKLLTTSIKVIIMNVINYMDVSYYMLYTYIY